MKAKNAHNPRVVDVIQEHANRVRNLWRDIKNELDTFHRRDIQYEELAGYTQQVKSAVFDKLQRTAQPQIESLLCCLERLPENVRARLIGKACRSYPTLEHERLSYDPAQVSWLKTLARQSQGLTVIEGGNENHSLRTFLATAIGHTRGILTQRPPDVIGLDAHAADWFVPLAGVMYLNNLFKEEQLRERATSHWPNLAASQGHLVILNGVWSAMGALQGDIISLASRSHVVVADEQHSNLTKLLGKPSIPINCLAVSEGKEKHICVGNRAI